MEIQPALQKTTAIKDKDILIKFIFRFFSAAASIAGEIMPFGTAFFAADFTKNVPIISAVGVLFWSFFSGSIYIIKYAAALILFTVFIKRFTYFKKKAVRRGLLMGACVFFSGFLSLFGNNILLYDIALMAFEGVLNIAFTVIFDSFSKAVQRKNSEGFFGENIFYAASVVAAVNMGIAGFLNFSAFSFSHCVAAFSVLVFSGGAEISAAAAAGLILGFSALGDNSAAMMCSFGIAAMCTSRIHKYGKSAAALTFIITFSTLAIYFDGFVHSFTGIFSALAGGVIYVLLPASTIKKIMPCTKNDKNAYARINMLAKRDMVNISEALSDVADTFCMLCNNHTPGTDNAANVFFDKTIKWVCGGCKRAGICWKKDFHITYAAFFVMLRLCEEKGELKNSDLPESIRENCLNPARLISAYNTKLDSYKTDKLWESRINEGRFLISAQLKGISEMLYEESNKFYKGIRFNPSAETLAEAKLAEHKVDAEVNIFEDGDKIRAEVNIFEGEGKRNCVESIISQCLSVPMCTIRDKGESMSLVSHKNQTDAFCTSIVKSKSGISGDSFGRAISPFGTEYFILSDGMGSGEAAGQNSRAAVSLVKNMLAAGFSERVVIGMVNSIFMLKSSETSFATLDLLAIEDGFARFYKIGASESYVITDGECVCIKSETLPAGVMPKAEAEEKSVRISKGSKIVMMSDGTYEALCEKNYRAEDIILSFKGDAKSLCKKILSLASDGEIQDDMTVAAVFIE